MGNLPQAAQVFLQEEAGSEALEMAMVLPVYLMTVFTVISFLLVMFGYASAVLASQMGVRYAEVHSSTSLAPCSQSSVSTLVSPLVMAPMATKSIATSWGPGGSPAGGTIGGTVTVSVTLNYNNTPYGFLNSFQPVATAQGIIVN